MFFFNICCYNAFMEETNLINAPILSKKENTAKIISIIVFSLIVTAFIATLAIDIAIVGKAIAMFIFSLFAAVMVFVVAFVLFVLSCIFVFGIKLLESHGFWPINWAVTTFKQINADYTLTSSQISALSILRIIIFAVCILSFIASIVVLSLIRVPKKEKGQLKVKTGNNKLSKAFGIVSLIMSILGAFASMGALLIISALN